MSIDFSPMNRTTQIDIEAATRSLKNFWETYANQELYTDFCDQVFLDDALYAVGISIDNQNYSTAPGYDRFKQFLRDYLIDPAQAQTQEFTAPLNGKYGEVLRPFVTLMEKELHANSGKGDRPGWLSMTPETAMLEIYYHVAKLQKAVKNGDLELIKEHSADVANMSMMMVDIFGQLDQQETNDA